MTLDVNRPDLTVGVVGTGAMGRGIAQVTAQGGMKAIMFDAAAGGAAKAKAAILETLKGLVTKGRLTDADRRQDRRQSRRRRRACRTSRAAMSSSRRCSRISR